MTNFLALDQSSKTTGFTVVSNNKIIKIGYIECKDSKVENRLVQFKQQIISLIEEYSIDKVFFEDIQLQTTLGQEVGMNTFKVLAQVQGALMLILTERGIPYSIIKPIQWKAFYKIAGKGRKAEKAMTRAWVKNHLKIDCSEDEADSVCLGIYALSLEER